MKKITFILVYVFFVFLGEGNSQVSTTRISEDEITQPVTSRKDENPRVVYFRQSNSPDSEIIEFLLDSLGNKMDLNYETKLIKHFAGTANGIYEGKNGRIWISSGSKDRGAICLDSQYNSIEVKYPRAEGIKYAQAPLLFLGDIRQDIWTCHGNQLFKYEEDEWKLIKEFNGTVRLFFEDKAGNLWLIEKYIHRFDGTNWYEYNESNGFNSDFRGVCWVANALVTNENVCFGMIGGVNIYSYADNGFKTLNEKLNKPKWIFYLVNVKGEEIWAFPFSKDGLVKFLGKGDQVLFNKKNAKNVFPFDEWLLNDKKELILISRKGKFFKYVGQEWIEIKDSICKNECYFYSKLYNYVRSMGSVEFYEPSLVYEAKIEDGKKIPVINLDILARVKSFSHQMIDSKGNIWIGFSTFFIKIEE